jgi:hypothetical protein
MGQQEDTGGRVVKTEHQGSPHLTPVSPLLSHTAFLSLLFPNTRYRLHLQTSLHTTPPAFFSPFFSLPNPHWDKAMCPSSCNTQGDSNLSPTDLKLRAGKNYIWVLRLHLPFMVWLWAPTGSKQPFSAMVQRSFLKGCWEYPSSKQSAVPQMPGRGRPRTTQQQRRLSKALEGGSTATWINHPLCPGQNCDMDPREKLVTWVPFSHGPGMWVLEESIPLYSVLL